MSSTSSMAYDFSRVTISNLLFLQISAILNIVSIINFDVSMVNANLIQISDGA